MFLRGYSMARNRLGKGFAALLLFQLWSTAVSAQQEPKWNQYMFNDFFYNPGVTGSRNAISTMVASRYQWVNIPENASPRTTCFSIHAPVEFLRGGLGLLVVQDEEYFNKSTNVRLNYALRIPLRTFSIGLGVYGGML
ncbi:MAG: type IX secretion system membrane protein PorP/SprF, partial [Sphingobacteriia bacterium]|nr:type IX secretion system membrane protein PorP/SprF [Sphingobacteriia bacterium]